MSIPDRRGAKASPAPMTALLSESRVADFPLGAMARMAADTTGKNSPAVTAWRRRAASIDGKSHEKKPSSPPASDRAYPATITRRSPTRASTEAAVVMVAPATMANPSTIQLARASSMRKAPATVSSATFIIDWSSEASRLLARSTTSMTRLDAGCGEVAEAVFMGHLDGSGRRRGLTGRGTKGPGRS